MACAAGVATAASAAPASASPTASVVAEATGSWIRVDSFDDETGRRDARWEWEVWGYRTKCVFEGDWDLYVRSL